MPRNRSAAAPFSRAGLYRHSKAGYERFCKDTFTLYQQIMSDTASDADITNFIGIVEAEQRLFHLVGFIMPPMREPVTMPPHPRAGMERVRTHFRHRIVMMNDTYSSMCPASFGHSDRLMVREAMLEMWKYGREVEGVPPMTPEEEQMRIFGLNLLVGLPVTTNTRAPPAAATNADQFRQSVLDHVHADPHLHIGEVQPDGSIREL